MDLKEEKLKRQRKKSLKLLEEDDEIEETKKIICNRKFCFSCLKQNYDQIIPLHINKICWICPHCQVIFSMYKKLIILFFKGHLLLHSMFE